MCRASILSCDMKMIFYSNITININITNPTFNRVLKIFIMFFSYHKLIVKMFFHHISTRFAFFDHTINKTVNSILTFPLSSGNKILTKSSQLINVINTFTFLMHLNSLLTFNFKAIFNMVF